MDIVAQRHHLRGSFRVSELSPAVHTEGAGTTSEAVALGTIFTAVAVSAVEQLFVLSHVG